MNCPMLECDKNVFSVCTKGETYASSCINNGFSYYEKTHKKTYIVGCIVWLAILGAVALAIWFYFK
jgi:hypothetical protein